MTAPPAGGDGDALPVPTADRIARAAPLATVIALHPAVSGTWGAGALLGTALLIAIVSGPRDVPRSIGHALTLLTAFVGFAVGSALSAGDRELGHIGSVWSIRAG